MFCFVHNIYLLFLLSCFDTANVKAISKHFDGKYWDPKPTSQKHELKGKNTGWYDFAYNFTFYNNLLTWFSIKKVNKIQYDIKY